MKRSEYQLPSGLNLLMELPETTTFICGEGGKTNVQFKEDRIVTERSECYRDGH